MEGGDDRGEFRGAPPVQVVALPRSAPDTYIVTVRGWALDVVRTLDREYPGGSRDWVLVALADALAVQGLHFLRRETERGQQDRSSGSVGE
jgi:hypothetical protein